MPGTSKREKPSYRASKSWDYVSSDSLASSELQPPYEEPVRPESVERQHSEDELTVNKPHNGGPNHTPLGMNSLENIISALSEEHQNTQGVPDELKMRDGDDGRLPGTLYAILLSLLGIVFPLKEAFQRNWLGDYIIAVYYVYLYGLSFIFLIGVEIYLIGVSRREQGGSDKAKKPEATPSILSFNKDGIGVTNLGYEDDGSQESEQGKITIITKRQISRSASTGDDLFYIQTKDWSQAGNYRTSLYLRIAIIVLGLATMVYDGLLIKEFQELSSNSACTHKILFWPHCVHLAFLLVQTYFLFKHPQIQVSSFRCFIRFGFMHVFAANWCMGFRTFVRQTMDMYGAKESLDNALDLAATSINNSDIGACKPNDEILSKAAPYLYPCVYEYCLLAGAIIYGMFTHNLRSSQEEIYDDPGQSERQAQLKEINCHHTHKGLFLGIVAMAGTCTGIILFFSYLQGEDEQLPLLIYQISDIALHFIILLLIIVSWVQVKKLTYSPDPDGFDIAGIVLFVTMSASLLLYLFKIIAVVEDIMDGNSSIENILSICASLLSMLVAIAQSCFVMESLCRYTFTEVQYEKKYGRGCITFLLIINISLWFFKTFQMKALELEAAVFEDTYGFLPWQIVVHATVPSLIFYYLHCSACLATVWGQAYRHADKPPGPKSRLNSTHSVLSTPVKYLHAGEVRLRGEAARKLNMNNIPEDNIVSPISDV